MTPHPQTLAFFGATGGVLNTTLAHALKAGTPCTALARTPQKLIDMLRTTHNVPLSTIETHLTIHKGDIKDPAALTPALRSPLDPTKLVDTILFGVGGYPVFQLSLLRPIVFNDPTICQDGTRAIFTALEALAADGVTSSPAGAKPLFVSISTTGISDKTRDVPLLLYPVYIYALHVPHVDKKAAEQMLVRDAGAHIRDCVVVRPTLLSDAHPRGAEGVRVGWEWKGEEVEREGVREVGPALGWSVGRKDVGGWVWERVLSEGGWEGRCVSLTY